MVERVTRFAVLAVVAAAALSAGYALADKRSDEIATRLKPVGVTCMAGEECASGPGVALAANGARDAEEIYTTKCFSCHNTGVGGAPKLGDTAAWAPRIAKGMEVLFSNAWNGFNAMPPKGICMDCSEEEMRATVQYMVDESQ